MKRKYVILLHVVFWILFLANNLWSSISRGILSGHKNLSIGFLLFCKYLVMEIGYLLIPMFCFYSAYLLVAPQIIVKKNYIKAILLAILTLLFIIAYRYVIEYHFFLPVLGFDNYNGNPYSVTRYLSNIFFIISPATLYMG